MRRGGMAAAALVLALVLIGAPVEAASYFATPAFQQIWQVGEAAVPNFWGPLATARDGQIEPYVEGTAGAICTPDMAACPQFVRRGARVVQYFDKARMEQNAVGSAVTTGLLTVELETGRVQVGDDAFEQRSPAAINVAGDPGSDGPTYADLGQLPKKVSGAPGIYGYSGGQFARAAEGAAIPGATSAIQTFGPGAYLADPGGRYGQYVPQAFIDYINSLPLPFSQTVGYPVTPLFSAQVRINGTLTPVFVQGFERRVLTYNPNNPTAFRIEFGNIGRHYYTWRYCAGASQGAPCP